MNAWQQQSAERPKPSLEEVWEERRMLFWTIHQVLGAIVLAALTIYFVVSLIEGRLPDELLRMETPWQLPVTY
jgi:hypothetical protein